LNKTEVIDNHAHSGARLRSLRLPARRSRSTPRGRPRHGLTPASSAPRGRSGGCDLRAGQAQESTSGALGPVGGCRSARVAPGAPRTMPWMATRSSVSPQAGAAPIVINQEDP
jgi:hypothetical protein